MNFNAFKDTFSQGVSFLKRRFSSSDLSEDIENEMALPRQQTQQRPEAKFLVESKAPGSSFATSAPTSPARQGSTTSSLMHGLTKSILQGTGQKKTPAVKEHAKCLLVIDKQNIDWSKYFRGKKVLGDWEIQVEQTEFSRISIVSQSEPNGCTVEIDNNRVFRPDFVLIREAAKEIHHDYRPVLLGLLYGGVPSLNSLHSLYNFTDKPWVFSHLLMIQRRLGIEQFPLIDQVYCYKPKDLCSATIRLPAVVKIGQAFHGLGKIKISTAEQLEDFSSIIPLCDTYCTSEIFVDAKYDVLVQKIGPSCKAFM
ncbi:unnamed protein product [Soboliphyme baturini]|uniref:Synapsin-2 n=1 Tax=Soboliphyme baturini TaxID=241478 RepID=A0A183ILQ8_9BILA|nr:unnamed protein product [Soboliphyme baturini]